MNGYQLAVSFDRCASTYQTMRCAFRNRARDCRNLASGARDIVDAGMLEEIAAKLEEEAAKFEEEERPRKGTTPPKPTGA